MWQVMPWDSDMDVMVTESSIYYLAAYYNMTTFWFKTGYKRGKDYLLEVNPNYSNREQTDVHNRIDARWIDTETGLFIDITAARYNLTHPQGEGMMTCKDGHEFRVRLAPASLDCPSADGESRTHTSSPSAKRRLKEPRP